MKTMCKFACAAMLVLGLSACQPTATSSPADIDALRSADIAWNQSFVRADLEAAVAAVEPKGSILSPNEPIATGTEAVTEFFREFMALPDIKLHWAPEDVEVAACGDLGVTRGVYHLSFTVPAGGSVMDTGKYVTVWRKQADGSWKVVYDIFNSDLPVAGPEPADTIQE